MGARRAASDPLTAQPYAHRGLHGPGVPENSLAAAHAAMASGFGMECDVRLSRDGIVHVFHDARLDRMTQRAGPFHALDSDMIATLRLKGSDEPVPRFSTLLALAGETMPLLVEIKSDRGPRACAHLCAAVARDLDGHAGSVAAMSFDPLVVRWFARHRPALRCGLVVSRRHRWSPLPGRGMAAAIARARPDFIACDVRDLPGAATLPARLGLPLLCWTVRSAAEHERAARCGAQIIFENRP